MGLGGGNRQTAGAQWEEQELFLQFRNCKLVFRWWGDNYFIFKKVGRGTFDQVTYFRNV